MWLPIDAVHNSTNELQLRKTEIITLTPINTWLNCNISYVQKANATRANTQDLERQTAPPAHRPAYNLKNQSAASASTCMESNVNIPPTLAISGNSNLSVLMTASKELRKLMKEAPQLIAALQTMKYANNTADKLQVLMNACASSDFLDDP
ncbi:hypothetical protein AVEN_35638-1 [Araneus ventricosus]|uniref:Uncharacterized protein n=1 Tax=Araneus ventricosus TaxID=182803 RepID=A0A4Y2QAL1_ARAVE|nr:hypothetical protein AVEN_35638-1 [Araneus ventricosus]